METAEDINSRAGGRTKTVWVCPDGGLFSRWREAEADYDRAKQMRGGTLGDDDDTGQLRAEAERLRDEVDQALVPLEMGEVRPGRVRQLKADHAVSKEAAAERGMRPGQLDPDTFWPALGAEAIVKPAFTVDKLARLLDSNGDVYQQVTQALDDLHGVKGDPKAQVDAARRLRSSSKTTPPPS